MFTAKQTQNPPRRHGNAEKIEGKASTAEYAETAEKK
jgi:hypothetical protein